MALRFLVFLLVCHGNAAVAQSLPSLIPYTNGEKWGYADTTGRVVIAPQWDDACFFQGERAVVRIYRRPGNLVDAVHCTIDRNGQYIIPPSAGWRGRRTGWDILGLNAVDSLGRWGLVDTNNGVMLIPHAWEGAGPPLPGAMRDSFFIVRKAGHFGLIDRKGDLVIPAVWGDMHAFNSSDSTMALSVSDPNNTGGYNRNGVITLQNQTVLPPSFYEITPILLPSGSDGFVASKASHNEVRQSVHPTFTYYRVEFPSGKMVDSTSARPTRIERREPGGYISFSSYNDYRRGLMDSARNVLITCCRVTKVTADTVSLRDETYVGKDSLVITDTYLDARTLKPHGPPLILVLYREEARLENLRRSGRHSSPARIAIKDYAEIAQFYKDSMLYTVQGRATADEGKAVHIVYGYSRRNGQSSKYQYFAVVDSTLNYVVPAIRDYSINAYNPTAELVIAYGYSSRHGASGHTVLSREGEALVRPQADEILDAFRWRGKVYAYAVKRRQDGRHGWSDFPPTILETFIIDSSGKHLLTLSEYRAVTRFHRAPSSFQAHNPILIADSTGRVAFVWPDGKQAYPKLAFRYSEIIPVSKDWFLVTDGMTKDKTLVDKNGHQILKDFRVQTIEKAIFPSSRIYYLSEANNRAPRVYFVNGNDDARGELVQFYLDDRGRVYYPDTK